LKMQGDWAQRVSAIKQHYRQTFRINKRWMDKMVNLSPYRAAICNTETGGRERSTVYCDYSVQLSLRGKVATGESAYVINVESIDRAFGQLLADVNIGKARPAGPARVSPADMQLGIFSVTWHTDPMGHYARIFPSQVVNAPTYDLSNRNNPRMFDEKSKNQGLYTSLARRQDLSVIMTASPPPGTKHSLFKMEFRPDDLDDAGIKGRVRNARACKYQIRVPAQDATIRIAWNDDLAKDHEGLFRIGNKEPDFTQLLILNEEETREYALGLVTEFYARWINRFRGSITSSFTPGLEPSGTIDNIDHNISDGALATTLAFRDEVLTKDLNQFLTPEVRAFFNHEIKKEFPQ